jgi:predicted AAA+ superfamily ATPase
LEDQIRLNSFFSSLLKYGLFPEIVLQTDEFVKQKLLDEYFDLIYYKDIVERNNFRNF